VARRGSRGTGQGGGRQCRGLNKNGQRWSARRWGFDGGCRLSRCLARFRQGRRLPLLKHGWAWRMPGLDRGPSSGPVSAWCREPATELIPRGVRPSRLTGCSAAVETRDKDRPTLALNGCSVGTPGEFGTFSRSGWEMTRIPGEWHERAKMAAARGSGPPAGLPRQGLHGQRASAATSPRPGLGRGALRWRVWKLIVNDWLWFASCWYAGRT